MDRANLSAEVVNLITSHDEYVAAFREAGLGEFGDDPVIVAGRIRSLDIRSVIITALDDWVTCTRFPTSQTWLMDVAHRADGEPADWRARARDPNIWNDKAALASLIKDLSDESSLGKLASPGNDASVSLLIMLGDRVQSSLGSTAAIPFLERVQRAHPSDYWVNAALGSAMMREKRYAEAIRYFQACVAIRPDAAVAHVRLGEALGEDRRIDDAIHQFQQAAKLKPTWFCPSYSIGVVYGRAGRLDAALIAFREAELLAPSGDALKVPDVARQTAHVHDALSNVLWGLGRPNEAIVHSQRAVALHPQSKTAVFRLRDVMIAAGQTSEGVSVWRKHLETAGAEATHSDWHGYAEVCLFLGRETEYRRARQTLLSRFSATNDANIADRAGRACLLLPGTAEELRQATAMVDRALAAAAAPAMQHFLPYFQFAKSLAEYRNGNMAGALDMASKARGALHPAPDLVAAMAHYRMGHEQQAREILAKAIASFDWSPERLNQMAIHRDVWIYHILRREAEGMILSAPYAK